ncbi:DUF4870 domain-containing protein [Sulfuriflexus mobilis]|uniref:DUF4870 domain-containing protein n=1 Tax=Sulfuriflexus mobilis TaxID=1811807 RepID=UPI0018D57D35|nr:DUF4870 domain-containing protein [Sulfuriflexus mobilis]
MRRTGFLLGLLGLVMFIGGVVSFFVAYFHSSQENEAGRLRLQVNQGYQSAAIRVDNRQRVRLAVRMQVTSRSVQEIDRAEGKGFQARYRFPLRVDVKDPEGKLLHSYECDLAWDRCGNRSQKNADINSQGGSLQVTHQLDSFGVGAAEAIHLEALLGSDNRYAATASNVQLIIYDQVESPGGWYISGFALCLLGPILFIVGLLMFLLAPTAKGAMPAAPTEDTPTDVSSRNMAMAVHLSALIAWVGVPFGHIIGPLVVWLTQKDKSAFIDRHGRESLNFQLSITLYSLLALVLCFIFIGCLLLLAIFVMHLTLSIIAAMHANEGQHYRYPMTIRFIP